MKKAISLCLLIIIFGCVPFKPTPKPRVIAGPEADMRRAVAFEKEKRYPDAIAAYRKILTNYPQSPVASDALFAIAHLHAFYDNPQKDYTKALADFENFEKRYPNHEKAEEAKNWQAVLKLIIDMRKENSLLHMSIDQLEKEDIRHEEKRKQ